MTAQHDAPLQLRTSCAVAQARRGSPTAPAINRGLHIIMIPNHARSLSPRRRPACIHAPYDTHRRGHLHSHHDARTNAMSKQPQTAVTHAIFPTQLAPALHAVDAQRPPCAAQEACCCCCANPHIRGGEEHTQFAGGCRTRPRRVGPAPSRTCKGAAPSTNHRGRRTFIAHWCRAIAQPMPSPPPPPTAQQRND